MEHLENYVIYLGSVISFIVLSEIKTLHVYIHFNVAIGDYTSMTKAIQMNTEIQQLQVCTN